MYGQMNMPLQPPPFHYPMDTAVMTRAEESSNLTRGNQVPQSSARTLPTRRGTSRAPRREILKQSGRQVSRRQRAPTQRRLVNFMPEPWQQSVMTLPGYDSTLR